MQSEEQYHMKDRNFISSWRNGPPSKKYISF